MRPDVHPHRGRPRVLVRVPERLGQDRLRQRLDVLGNLHPVLPVELERQVLVVAAEPGELPAQRRAGVEARRRERSRERVAEVGEGGMHLARAALARLVGQRVLRAEHQRDAEQPLHHALVQLARQVDARLKQAGSALLARRDAHARGERRGLAERPHGVALLVGELEAGAAAVAEDHAEPAAAGRHRHAGERLHAAEARVALRHPALQVAGHLHHAVLGESHLRDRRLLERAVHLCKQARLETVAAHRHDELTGVVVEQQPGALHRRHAAARLAEAVVELAPRGHALLSVERAEQLHDHVECVRALGEGLAFGHCLL